MTLNENSNQIAYPTGPIITVKTDVDWIYIMRLDQAYVMNALGFNNSDQGNWFQEGYNTFCSQLAMSLLGAFSEKGKVNLHLFSSEWIEEGTNQKVGKNIAISLDPLIEMNQFKVSRGYNLGGKKDHGQVPRPGSTSLICQAKELKQKLPSPNIVVIEDDVFSGGSLIAALDRLIDEGFKINEVITGIQVGVPSALSERNIKINPVVSYRTEHGEDIFSKVDLGDPRDFLVGASGLVVKLPSGEYGRLPYILPFVSTSARASVPSNKEQGLAVELLHYNHVFWDNLGQHFGRDVLVCDLDPYFMKAIDELFGVETNLPMTKFLELAYTHLDEWWSLMEEGKSYV